MSAEFQALGKNGNIRAVALVTSNTFNRLCNADLLHRPKGSFGRLIKRVTKVLFNDYVFGSFLINVGVPTGIYLLTEVVPSLKTSLMSLLPK